MRRMLTLLLALMLLGMQVPMVLAQGEATPSASPPSMNEFLDQIKQNQVCAWPVKLDTEEFNVGFPDVNSAYFVIPYVLSPGQSIVVQGTYPFARFSSINTYYRDLSGLGSGLELLGWLPDYAIEPGRGQRQPAIDPNALDRPGPATVDRGGDRHGLGQYHAGGFDAGGREERSPRHANRDSGCHRRDDPADVRPYGS